uniref:Cytochrome b6-f complex subunit PetP n=1 Tax=Centroceras clavulatum TaxID=159503 RepID=A0A4D6WNN8_9FLOR|nr:cytochrome b6-f complex subunit PetP [Centroceras clavulatum]
MINKRIIFQQTFYKLNPLIFNYIYKSGKIVGYKRTKDNQNAFIIQFQDLTRIWMFKNEIKFINNSEIIHQ